MDNNEIDLYAKEVIKKWGNTSEYKEFIGKSKSTRELEFGKNQLMSIFVELGKLKQEAVESETVQSKIKELQDCISLEFYKCSNEVLKCLGQMYVADERFKNNIDKVAGIGTAEFVSKAIQTYCSKND